MRGSILLTLLAFAVLSAGCSKTGNAVSGSGFELLTPSAATRQFIIANDIRFGRQIAAHNETCQSMEGCRK